MAWFSLSASTVALAQGVIVTESVSSPSGLRLFTLTVVPGTLEGQYANISASDDTLAGSGIFAAVVGGFNQLDAGSSLPTFPGSDDTGLLTELVLPFQALARETTDSTDEVQGGLATFVQAGNAVSFQPVDFAQVVIADGADASFTFQFALTDVVDNVPVVVGTVSGQVGEVPATGDYNGDGVVDAADYTVWRDNLGGDGSALQNRDPQLTGDIDTNDYVAWRENFGLGQTATLTYQASRIPPVSASAAPEPATALAALAVASWLRAHRRR